MTEDEEQECGYAYDHDLEHIQVVDGQGSATCRECGAELFWDEEDNA